MLQTEKVDTIIESALLSDDANNVTASQQINALIPYASRAVVLYDRAISIDDQQRVAEFYVVMVVAVLHMMECIYAGYVAVTESIRWNHASLDTAAAQFRSRPDNFFKDNDGVVAHEIRAMSKPVTLSSGFTIGTKEEGGLHKNLLRRMSDQDLKKAIYDCKLISINHLHISAESLHDVFVMLPLYEQETKRRASERSQQCAVTPSQVESGSKPAASGQAEVGRASLSQGGMYSVSNNAESSPSNSRASTLTFSQDN